MGLGSVLGLELGLGLGSGLRRSAPQKTRGTEMQNHMQMSATMVPKGTAPEEPRPQMKKLRKSAPGQGWWLGLN